ncbi:MAG: YdcF family protein [Nitrospirae bacterium]|nr:YdcF family protein [Nitrospirota bacterium]
MRRACLRVFIVGAVLCAAAGLTLYLARGPVVRAMGRFLVVEDPIERADAIKVMAGDFPGVILEAADLYAEGYGRAIVLSGETRPAAWDELERRGLRVPYSAQLNRMTAEQLGVPAADIWVLGPPVQTTRQELTVLVGPLVERGVKSLLLVATKPHTRRCRMIAREVMEPHLRVIVRGSRYDGYDPGGWIEDRILFKSVFVEYQKLVNDALRILVKE